MPTNQRRNLDWSLSHDSTLCKPGEVHIWRIDRSKTKQLTDQHRQSLDDNERERAARFVRDQDRQVFVLAHAALRELLGRYLRIRPDRVQFSCDNNGKPFILQQDGNETVQFSLTHSGDWVLIAVAAEPVGIDVERRRDIENLPRMIQRICTSAEQIHLQQLLPEQRLVEFFRLWTIKEAVLKAAGCGLRVNPNSFETIRGNHSEWSAVELAWENNLTTWHVRQFTVDENHTAALAATRKGIYVRSGEWQVGSR